jgi:hypothetical protein
MKSYISRKFPLETRITDQIFDFRSLALGIERYGILIRIRASLRRCRTCRRIRGAFGRCRQESGFAGQRLKPVWLDHDCDMAEAIS